MKNLLELKALRDLKRIGWERKKLKEEMRINLIKMMKNSTNPFPEILGYEETVIPKVENAILSGHNIIFLGERGQAKSRIIRSFINLLDEYMPAVRGCEIHDDPFEPLCKRCQQLKKEKGDELEIEWISREQRYIEKLATPDATIADLIGEIDPIKISEGRYLSDEEAIHFGLIPRSNRGIFAINELPDLAERVQVSLFNIMEEKDIQIKGYSIRLPLDVMIVATANPEDYTNRGRIVTPLKDRFDAMVRTHYPRTREIEIEIMEQECDLPLFEGVNITVPDFIKEVIAEMTFCARRSPDISQHSGVSVRMSISNYESVLANALKRAIRTGEKITVPRISDFHAIESTTIGKLEYEYTVEAKNESEILDNIMISAVKNIFNKYWNVEDFDGLIEFLNSGVLIEVGDDLPSNEYLDVYREVKNLPDLIKKVIPDESPASIASGIEFALEGLYSHNLVKKSSGKNRISYSGLL